MTVLHVVTNKVFPEPGGLEHAALRIAKSLALSGGLKVIVYTRRQSPEHAVEHPAYSGLEVAHLGQKKSILMEPLEQQAPQTEMVPCAYLLESFRVDYLLLIAAIRTRMSRYAGANHVLVSFLVTISGFVAQQVALTLDLPHIASVRGSDFSRDFRSPHVYQAMRFVVENAQLVVTTNHEQSRTLAAAFRSEGPFRTIHNAMEAPDSQMWTLPPSGDVVRLIADCEFFFKKGTHILLRSVETLVNEGMPVALTVAGRAARDEEPYWTDCQTRYSRQYPAAFSFPGWLPDHHLRELLLSSHVYVSATLGEGCSNARVRALTLGMPIVTTRCGALPDFHGSVEHVRMCHPGDLDGFTDELRSMVIDIQRGKVVVDQDQVRKWRRYFDPEREREEWLAAVADATQIASIASRA